MSDEQKLGKFVVQDQLGEGSFAWVYKGYDAELDRHVALKVLKPMWLADMQAVNRFKQEARTMAKLIHPNIAVIYEVGEDAGQVYLAQFLVDGNTLAKQLQDSGPLSWPAMLDKLRQVASALDYAHKNNMIHRDIKPANILVDSKGEAFLGDFGLVRAAEGSASISASTGGMVGTPAYMAPEQWEGHEVSSATDVYALTCVVFEMLTGRMLFDGTTPATVMKQHLMEGPKFPETWPADVPEEIGDVLKRGLAEDPGKRIQTAGELVTALETVDEKATAMFALPWLLAADGQKYNLKPGSTTLGRGRNADIQIDRAMISRQHATLEFNGKEVIVYDEGSANGTFVNGERLGTDGRTLAFGDTLMVGDTSFVLGAPNVEVSPPAAPPEESLSPAVGATAQTMMGSDALLKELAAEAASTKAAEVMDEAPVMEETAAAIEPEPEVTAPPLEIEEDEEQPTLVAEPEPVASRTAAPAAATVVTPPAKKSSNMGLIIGVAVVLLIVAGGAAFFLFGGNGGGGEQAASSSNTQPESSGTSAGVAAEPTATPTPKPPTATPEPATATTEPESPTPTSTKAPTATPEAESSETETESALDLDEIIAQADEYLNEGRYDEAIAAYDQAIELDPGDAILFNSRGNAYYGLGDYEQAIADYDQSNEIDPAHAGSYNGRGNAYYTLGDYEQAIVEYEQAIALDPNEGDFHWGRGIAYDALENFEEALISYQDAVAAFEEAGVEKEYYAFVEERIVELEAEQASAGTQSGGDSTSSQQPTATPAPAAASVTGHIAIPLLAGSEPRVYVTDTKGDLVNMLGSARQPKHTLDGSKLVVNGDGGGQLLLRMANSDGSNAQEFGDRAFNAHSFPTWSPDGKTVAYLDKFGTQEYHMFFRKADNSGGEGEEFFAGGPIYHANALYPQWTNNGIVFRGCSTWNGQGGDCGTWILTEQQGTASKITGDANHIPTDAAGNTMVFSWNQGGNWDVYKADISSGSVTPLTKDPAQDALGTISPDGKSVAFLSNRGGGLAVWRVGINGGEAEKLFDIPGDWGQLRGDGWSEETLSWGK